MESEFDEYDDETLVGYIIETLEGQKQERATLLTICNLITRIPPTVEGD